MANKWYEVPTQTKVNAYTQIAEEKGMTPYAVKKRLVGSANVIGNFSNGNWAISDF